MLDVTLWGAVLAGLISFVSPCVLPIVPPYLGFLAGVSLDELTAREPAGRNLGAAAVAAYPAEMAVGSSVRRRVFFAALAFVLGFTTVFVMLGATASIVGQTIARYFDVLSYIAGAVIIVMGLHFLGIFRIPLLYREARVEIRRRPAGLLGAYLVGLAFAFGWTPCVGPVLAAILFVAGSEETMLQGGTLLAAYSLGLGLPFLGAALFAGAFMKLMARFRSAMGLVEKTMGVLLVLTGVLFITGQMATMSYWLLETFPALGRVG